MEEIKKQHDLEYLKTIAKRLMQSKAKHLF